MLASPDEPLHIVRAQSISRGDLTSPWTSDGIPIDAIDCLRFQSEVTAACQNFEWGPEGKQYDIPTDNYPAAFHAIAALPALFVSGLGGLYTMRLWLAFLAASAFAWAGALLSRPGSGPWRFVGLCIGITPMVIFSAATVNPSGLASASAALMVAGLLNIKTPYRTDLGVRAAIAVGAVGLALLRRDGLVWLAVIAIVLTPLVGFGGLRRRLAAVTRAQWAVAGLFSILVAYALTSWALPTVADFLSARTEGGTDAWEAARSVRSYLFHVIGTFGWLDSPIGEEPFLVAMIVAGSVVLLGIVGSNRRLATSTAVGVSALVLSPIIFGVVRFPYFQGRYMLPLWICVMCVAGASVSSTRVDLELSRRLSRVLLTLWAAVHAVGLVQNLRRYSVGRSGSWGFIFDDDWHPPVMSNLVAVMLLALVMLNAAMSVRWILREVEQAKEGPRWGGCEFELSAQDLGDRGPPRSDFLGEPTGHAVENGPPNHETD